MAGISNNISPIYDRSVQPDAACTGAAALNMARQTATLAYRMAGNSRAFHWGSPDAAPWADLTSVGTNTQFSTGTTGAASATFWVPWRLTEQHNEIKAVVVLGTTAADLSLAVQLKSQTLITSVAASTGLSTRLHGVPASEVGRSLAWQSKAEMNNAKMRYASGIVTLIGPTLPAERVIALQFLVQADQGEYQLFRGAIGGSIRVYIKSLFIRCWNAK